MLKKIDMKKEDRNLKEIEQDLIYELGNNGTDKARDLFVEWQDVRMKQIKKTVEKLESLTKESKEERNVEDIIDLKWLVSRGATHEELIKRINVIQPLTKESKEKRSYEKYKIIFPSALTRGRESRKNAKESIEDYRNGWDRCKELTKEINLSQQKKEPKEVDVELSEFEKLKK